PQHQPPPEEQLRAQLATPQNDPDQVAPVAPEPIQESQPEEQPQTTQTQPFQPDSGIDNQWRSYRVEPGKTMAQLFRDHGLHAT
ncbi:LysM-like peptidoglycan-binding domain-containing protein, partial [Escherichia coli]|nr:LysM-like peptidoglycan-binding domain-containing protein [Escherichia coli]